MSSQANEKLILAIPKGRILKEAAPVFARAGIEPEPAFADPDARLDWLYAQGGPGHPFPLRYPIAREID